MEYKKYRSDAVKNETLEKSFDCSFISSSEESSDKFEMLSVDLESKKIKNKLEESEDLKESDQKLPK